MSSTTPNIGLTKTTAAETIGQNWAASNDSGGNFDIIDTKMGAVGNTSLQAQVTALNSKIAIQGVASVDFNTLTGDAAQVKWYNGTTFVGCSNVPSACSGQAWPFVLEVIKMGVYTKQILHCFAVLSQAPTSPTYVRQQTYGAGNIVWGDWSVK